MDDVALTAGMTLPYDRTWAVAHEASKADGSEWVPCANFSRGAKAPSLMAITAKLDPATETLTLSHPNKPDLVFSPDENPQDLMDWTADLIPEGRAQSARILRVQNRGMTDTDFPSIALLNLASLKDLAAKMEQPLSMDRFRGNLIMSDVPAWDEFNWIGKTLKIGEAELQVKERITRCLATTVNPETGQRDADTLGALETHWGHKDFGIYAVVTKSGHISTGDRIEVL